MNPFLGVFYHWLGGLASGSFYVPYKGVKKWAWEVYWLTGGFFSWIVCPWVLALMLTNDVVGVLKQQSWSTLWWTYFFGAMWGFGGLTFGLTMRYLGMSLGMGVALGYCAAFGTLIPPMFPAFFPKGSVVETLGQIAATTPGKITLLGVVVCLLGIAVAAWAGWTKEKEMPEEAKRKAIAEFSFAKGILVATFSGIMSACFAFAITWGTPIKEATIHAGTSEIWTGLPRYIVIMLGGITTNSLWCVLLYIKNKTGYQFFSSTVRNEPPAREQETIIETAFDAPSEEVVANAPKVAVADDRQVPMLKNYLFSALAGTTWYFQFFFYAMGEVKMGKLNFASWTLHMASIIIFSTMWGWILHEWKGASKRAHGLIAAGIALLILSTLIIGYGTLLKGGQTLQDVIKMILG
jgi:L-rhamnose-H+ transport protein